MLITIDTNDQTVEVLNEDTKDWEKGYLREYSFAVEMDSLVTMNLEIMLPIGVYP